MKTVFFKTLFLAVIVIFAVFLGTCAPELLPEGEESLEYTDVEYEITGGVGQERVKSVKLYLNGMVPVTPKQRAIHRALSADTAAASHDFFEAVFYCSANQIVRTTWEIGYPAGIQGSLLVRGNTTNYCPLEPGSAQASTVFVGRKTNKTLLGVGWLSAVNDTPLASTALGSITTETYAVTYTIAPIKTWVGFTSEDGDTPQVLRVRPTIYGYGDDTTAPGGSPVATFTTEVAAPHGGSKDLTPVQGLGSVTYPLFTRLTGTYPLTMDAVYRIGGLNGLTTGAPPAGTGTPNAPTSVLPAIRVYGLSTGVMAIDPETGEFDPAPTASTGPRGGLQVIKRKPTFLFNGRTYEASTNYDSFTTLTSVSPSTNGTNPTVNDVHGAAFNNVITMRFNITNQSSGIFAITFQCPVYAITTLSARNPLASTPIDTKNRFVKWFIRPADGPNLYLLDSGKDEGGMVMIGDTQSFSNDWIEIKTIGIGFQNN